jgi:NTP pyrophosphatase (non-canonical NTP hydrolase)
LKLNDYQKLAMSYRLPSAGLTYALLNFAAEMGEALGKVAKYLRDGGDKEKLREDMKKELGDCLWQIAAIAEDYDLTLEDLAIGNINKLSSRSAKGTLQGSGDDR